MEATTTLADALLDDLDDLNDSDDDQYDTTEALNLDTDGNNENRRHDDEGKNDTTLNRPTATLESEFLSNRSLRQHLEKIRKILNARLQSDIKESPDTDTSAKQLKEEEKDHELVVKSNKYLASLAEEIGRAHGELARTYKAKFPELEELLPNHLNYKNAVRVIGNETDLTRVNDDLNEILTSNQIITISVAASTTSGRQLTASELTHVDSAATYIEKLLEVQQQVITFVENSMESLCPSICALIGSSLAARLLGLAGGLQELTKVSNIM